MDIPLLAGLALLVAVLYSSVGHGGASGYLAAMALVGMAPAHMKPTALLLNVLVAGLGSYRYLSAGHFRFNVFVPFAIASIPFAYLGGATHTDHAVYRKVLTVILIWAAFSLIVRRGETARKSPPQLLVALVLGACIGYVSGLIGVGGGIFLSPLLILTGWVSTRETLGIASLFILVNSLAGLAGHVGRSFELPAGTIWLAVAAFVGGVIGSALGAKHLPPQWLKLLLASVILLAAGKLLLF